jgi:Family of unknown function (DUF6843)
MNRSSCFCQFKACLTVVAVLFFSLSLVCCGQQYSREPESYIFPEGYIGAFYIIFNAIEGRPREEFRDGRAYAIPKSGVLLTKLDFNPGWIDTDKIKFFYRQKSGELREITDRWSGSLADTPESRADTRVMIFGGEVGTFQESIYSCLVEHKAFYVGTKSDVLDMKNNFDISEIPDLEKIKCD